MCPFKCPLESIWANVYIYMYPQPFLGGSVVKNPPANAGDMGSIPDLKRSPGGENGNPFQYSCWENRIDREIWWATVHQVTKELYMT